MVNILNNRIINEFVVKGAKESVGIVDKNAQAQKNLAGQSQKTARSQQNVGKEAANTTRQFGAQASGLGGLVASYAGAAATIFAVQQAFSALARAAQAEEIVRGTQTLASEIGENGRAILKSVQDITQGQLTLAEAAQNVNIALSAGFNSEQIEKLTDVSLKASRALGRNLTDAIQRLIRGTAKLEPELLDEIGIFTRIDPAVRAYARAIGKTVSALTSFEKRQAFVTAALEEGERKFGTVGTALNTAQSSFERLSSVVIDLATSLGQTLSHALVPLAEFFSGTFGNQLLLLAGIGTLVFGKLTSVIGDFTKSSIAGFTIFGNKLVQVTKDTASFNNQMTKAVNEAVKLRNLPNIGGTTFFGNFEVGRQAEGVIQKLVAGENISLEEIRRNQPVLQQAIKNQEKIANDTTRTAAVQENAAQKAKFLTNVTKNLGNAYDLAGKKATFFSRSVAIATTVVRGFALGASILIKVLSGLFLVVGAVQLVGSLFDIDILGAIGKKISNITKESRELSQALKGVVASAQDSDVLNEFLRRGGQRSDFTSFNEGISERAEEAFLGVDSLRQAIGDRSFFDRAFSFGPITIEERKIAALKELQKQYTKALDAGKDLEALEISRVIDAIESNLISLNGVIKELSDVTGISAGAFGKLAKEGIIELNESTREALLQFEDMSLVIGSLSNKGISSLNKETRLISAEFASFFNTLKTSNDEFDRGALSAEKASVKATALANIMTRLETELGAAAQNTELSSERFEDLVKLYIKAGEEAEKFAEQATELQRLELLTKSLTTEFSKELRVLEKIAVSGNFEENLAFAKSGLAVATRRTNILGETLQKARDVREEVEKTGKANSNQERTIQNGSIAVKALLGRTVTLRQETEKLQKTADKRLETLRSQIEVLKLQNELQDEQNTLAIMKAEAESRAADAQNNIESVRTKSEFLRAQSEAVIKQLEASKELLKVEQDRSKVLQELAMAQLRLEQSQTALSNSRNIFNAQRRVDANELRPDSVSTDTAVNDRLALLHTEFSSQKKIIDLRERQIQKEYMNSLKNIVDRHSQLLVERDLINARIASARQETASDIRILRLEKQEQRSALKDRENQLIQEAKILDIEEQVALANIEANRQKQLQDIKVLDLQSKHLAEQARVYEAFIKDQKDLIEPFAKAAASLTGVNIDTAVLQATNNLREVVKSADKLANTTKTLKEETDRQASLQTGQTVDNFNTRRVTNTENLISNIKNQQVSLDLEEAKVKVLERQLKNRLIEFKSQLDSNKAAREKLAIEADIAGVTNEQKLTELTKQRQAVVQEIHSIGAGILAQAVQLLDASKENLATLVKQTFMLSLQTKLQREQSKLALINAREEIRAEEAQSNIESVRAKLEISEKQTDNTLKQLEVDKQLLELDMERAKVLQQIESSQAAILEARLRASANRDIFDAQQRIAENDQFSNLVTEDEQRAARRALAELEFELQEKILNMKEQQIEREYQNSLKDAVGKHSLLLLEKDLIEARLNNAQMEDTSKLKLLQLEQKEELAALAHRRAQLAQEKIILEAEKSIALANAESTRNQQLHELSLLDAQARQLEIQVRAFKEFIDGLEQGTNKLVEVANALKDTNIKPVEIKDLSDIANEVKKYSDGIQETNNIARGIINQNDRTRRAAIEDDFSTRGQINAERTSSIDVLERNLLDRQKARIDLTKSEIQTKVKELEISLLVNERKRQNIVTDLELAETQRQQKLEELMLERQSNQQKLSALIAQHGREANEYKNFANSLSGNLKQTLGDGIRDITENVINGTENIGSAFKRLMFNILRSIQDTITEQLITKPLQNLVGSGISSVFGFGGGSATSSLAGNVNYLYAGGGSVPKMNSGGLRDRVPAFLEPGEFVMRRQAVNAIGLPDMQRINSGVYKSGKGDVSVNITNQGTPQETEGEPQIRFDAERMVVDIVLRDINNNGPIRRNLKGLRA